MKALIIAAAAMALLSGSAGAQFTRASLQATGLTCAMCSKAIFQALQQVPFVESVKADIKNSGFEVSFKTGSQVDIDAMPKAVEDAGFAVGSFTITGHFEKTAIANDKHVTIGRHVFHFLDVSQQELEGEKTITLVDRSFVTAKKFRKISNSTKLPCLQTGKTAACCTRDGITEGSRVYHATI